MSDAQIRRDCQLVIDRLGPHPHVQIMIRHGWVALRGAVRRGADRWEVEEAICRVPGVVGATAQLTVQPDQQDGASDRAVPGAPFLPPPKAPSRDRQPRRQDELDGYWPDRGEDYWREPLPDARR